MASVINLSAADNGEHTTVLSAARRVILRSKVVIARGIKVHLALCTIKVTRALAPAASRKRTARVCVWARFMESPSWCWLGAVGACTNGLTAAFKLAPIPTGIQLWAKYICMEMRLATSAQRNNHTHTYTYYVLTLHPLYLRLRLLLLWHMIAIITCFLRQFVLHSLPANYISAWHCPNWEMLNVTCRNLVHD
jgi:hypothetical protein